MKNIFAIIGAGIALALGGCTTSTRSVDFSDAGMQQPTQPAVSIPPNSPGATP